MTSEITSALKCYIGSIQLNLFDFGSGKPKLVKVLNQRFQTPKIPRNVNQALNLLENNHFDYVNPECPKCNSKKVIKQEYQERNPILGEFGQQKIYLRKYKCKNCGRKFVTSLNSIIKPHHRYAKIYTNKLKRLIQTGYRSLRKLGEDFQTFFGNTPSHQTIKNWLTTETENRIRNQKEGFSGYYTYDEQYLRINGKRKYRLTLYDTKINIPLAEEIVPKRTPQAIKNFIIE